MAKRSDLDVNLGEYLQTGIVERLGKLKPVKSTSVGNLSSDAAKLQIEERFPIRVQYTLDHQLPHLLGITQESDLDQRLNRIIEWAVMQKLRQLQGNHLLGTQPGDRALIALIYDTLGEMMGDSSM
jgi:hypothetical protein